MITVTNNRRMNMKRTLCIALALIGCLAAAAAAEIPQLLNYQGVLTDAGGMAVPDNTYSITFSIYDVSVGGSALWTETDDVVVSKGVFNATLGTKTGLASLSFDETYYLGMSVEGEPELPRQILTTSPYTFTAKSVLGMENVFPSSGDVGIGTLSPTSPLHIHYDNTNPSGPAIAIDNDAIMGGGQNVIDFMFEGTTQSRIRQARGGALFLGTVTNNDVRFTTNDQIRGGITASGDWGVGTTAPAEKLEVVGGLKIGGTSNMNAGTMRWTGADFEGYDGADWKSFTDTGTGTLPSGSSGQTLRHDGADWVATSNLYNDGTKIGIGTAAPDYALHVATDDICGLFLDGSAAGSWSLLRINADGAGSSPGIEFFRQNSSRAVMYIGLDDDWHFRIAGSDRLVVDAATSRVGIGAAAPVEMLDVAGALHLGTTANSNAGAIRWTGSDFEGYDGASWKSFTDTGTGTLPSGSSGQTLRHDGADWVATSSLYNDGTNIGIGTATPGARVNVLGSSNQDVLVETSSSTGRASLVLKSTGGSFDYLELDKYGPSAGGTTGGSIPLANLSRIAAGSLAGPMMLQVITDNPMYFVTHNLERMRLTGDGKLGINTTTPEAALHVDGNQWDLTNTEGDFKIGSHDYRLKFGVATGGGGAGTAGIRVVGGAQKLILGGGASEVLSLDATGNVSIGSSSASGELELYRSGVAGEVMRAYTSGAGGNLTMSDEAGNPYMYVQPDGDGTGGFLSVYRGIGLQGFTVNGNYLNSGSTYVGIYGGSRSSVFNMNNSGNSSVSLPVDAISAPEILDEPGAASYATSGGATLGASPTVIGSRTIVAPDSGYVLVIATAQVQPVHVNGTTSTANFGVSDVSDAFPANQDVAMMLVAGLPSGTYCFPVAVHGLFKVDVAGSHTYYFLGELISGSSNSCVDVQLTLLYIPTSYGTIQPTLATGRNDGANDEISPAMTRADVAAQRVRSEAVNAERIQKELDAMRAEIESLRQAVENK
jgi:hypothetical protein